MQTAKAATIVTRPGRLSSVKNHKWWAKGVGSQIALLNGSSLDFALLILKAVRIRPNQGRSPITTSAHYTELLSPMLV